MHTHEMHGFIIHCLFQYLSDACGGLIDTSNGTITSPSFPDLYPANKNCIWEILAPPQWRITVNFTHFDIEGNNVSIVLWLKIPNIFFIFKRHTIILHKI